MFRKNKSGFVVMSEKREIYVMLKEDPFGEENSFWILSESTGNINVYVLCNTAISLCETYNMITLVNKQVLFNFRCHTKRAVLITSLTLNIKFFLFLQNKYIYRVYTKPPFTKPF